jgi:streptomycin 6-kinase
MATETPAIPWGVVEAGRISVEGLEAARGEAREAWDRGDGAMIVQQDDLARLLAEQAGAEFLILIFHREGKCADSILEGFRLSRFMDTP